MLTAAVGMFLRKQRDMAMQSLPWQQHTGDEIALEWCG
jgi:hypothetical protein